MMRRRWVNTFAVGVFVWVLLIGFADPAVARGRRHHSRFHFGFGLHSHHYHHHYHGHYPFWGFHYYGYPFWFYYDEPYHTGVYYWAPNFRLPAFFHYPGAVGKGEITSQHPDDKAVSQESPQR